MKSKCCNHEVKKVEECTYCANCLTLIKVEKSLAHILLSISIGCGLLFASLSAFAPDYLGKRMQIVAADVSLNDSALVAYMQEIGILFPEIVLQQIHWESAHFKSKVCQENHNLLGIKYIKQKEATGSNRGHAVYPSFKACLRDYKRLQKYYLGNLAGKYAEDPNYVTKLIQ